MEFNMADPLYPVGARVIYQGRTAVVEHHSMWFYTWPDGARVQHFRGYELLFDDGSFSGWHPEADLVSEDDRRT